MRMTIAACFMALAGAALAQPAGTSLTPRPGWAAPPVEPRPGWAAPPNPPRPGWAPPAQTQYYTYDPRRCYWVDSLYGSRRVCDD